MQIKLHFESNLSAKQATEYFDIKILYA